MDVQYVVLAGKGGSVRIRFEDAIRRENGLNSYAVKVMGSAGGMTGSYRAHVSSDDLERLETLLAALADEGNEAPLEGYWLGSCMELRFGVRVNGEVRVRVTLRSFADQSTAKLLFNVAGDRAMVRDWKDAVAQVRGRLASLEPYRRVHGSDVLSRWRVITEVDPVIEAYAREETGAESTAIRIMGNQSGIRLLGEHFLRMAEVLGNYADRHYRVRDSDRPVVGQDIMAQRSRRGWIAAGRLDVIRNDVGFGRAEE